MKCRRCKGKGFTIEQDWDTVVTEDGDWDTVLYDDKVTCPACNGTGRISLTKIIICLAWKSAYWKKCKFGCPIMNIFCHGTGRIPLRVWLRERRRKNRSFLAEDEKTPLCRFILHHKLYRLWYAPLYLINSIFKTKCKRCKGKGCVICNGVGHISLSIRLRGWLDRVTGRREWRG